MNRGAAQTRAGPRAQLLVQFALECDRLLPVKPAEIAKVRRFLKTVERRGDAVNRRLVAPPRFAQIDEISALDPFVNRMVSGHVYPFSR
jgi:hypothetical protein